ncbi:GNAT family N-acetyltransferase [Colwellia piezophila]|uniref:GNAT family N-acetyltransferase n=1 Tax=Colwellia piezophila TaxID=211668 RepID=UPI000478015F|nr:GNAT family N-acetyltransferase [Colwellia piezophila]
MKFTLGFRKVKHEDLDFLLELRRKTMTQHLLAAGIRMTDEEHLVRIKEHFYESHIVLADRKPIGLIKMGIVALNDTHKSLHIRQLQIMPKFQGKGVGSKVIMVVKKRALQLCLPITLNVLLKNPARGLYLRHGFQVEKKTRLEFQLRCPLTVIAA